MGLYAKIFKMKYAVFTYIFGKNEELLREPKFLDNNIEFICVTDQISLKSDIWKIIYEPIENVKSLRDKTAITKFNPFKYTNADRIIIQDSSLECINSLKEIFKELDYCDICLKKHPQRENLEQELPEWKVRGLSDNQINKFKNMAKNDGIKLSDVPLYECCVIAIKNNKETKGLFNNLLSLMNLLGENGNMVVTQQCTFAYLIKTFYPNLKIGKINQNKFFTRYIHNSNKVNIL